MGKALEIVQAEPVLLPKGRPLHVAMIMGAKDQSLFFAQAPKSVSGVRLHWLREPGHEGRMLSALARLNPSVIVTGWHSPFLTETFIEKELPGLKYVCHAGGSVRQIVPRLFLERGGQVSNWGESVSHLVAEHALLLVLSCLRDTRRWKAVLSDSTSDKWSDLSTRTLFGRRVGIHGFGSVARKVISLLRPFGVEVKAYSRGVPSRIFSQEGVCRTESLAELFQISEVLIECEALTDATRRSVDRKLLELLPNDAVFVNVGRGAVVDEEALFSMAKSNRLRVGLDVLASEPAKPDVGLLELPNVVISPHIGGPTWDHLAACGARAMANVMRYARDERIEDRVTLEMYDRST